MSYQVLARKWRPRHFDEIVGQEHVLRMLRNALDQKKLHHAYLLTGTRGTGKTTIARILSKCLNCELGIRSNPCGECDACRMIDQGRFFDLFEIDAASRTKVEDTREILDNVQYAPTQGRFKIYLIDEVHMLSGHSFNALLKTLEEPPSHVKFILATTDPKKLPITILSRCLQFHLKRMPIEQLTAQLSKICSAENIPFEIGALELLSQAADGSMRDALSLLDQAIAYGKDNLMAHDIRTLLGTIEQDYIFALLDFLAQKDGKKLLTEIQKLYELVPNYEQVLDELMLTLHQIAICQVISEMEFSENIKKFAKLFTAEDIQLYYQIALIGKRDLLFSPNMHRGFEMIMLRMLAFHLPSSEKKSLETAPLTENNWNEILGSLGLTGMAQVLASNCILDKIENCFVELALCKTQETLLNNRLIERIEQALSQYFQKPMKLKIRITEKLLNTPIKLQEKQQKIRHQSATEAIQMDSTVQKIVDVFGATLDLNSIQVKDEQGQ